MDTQNRTSRSEGLDKIIESMYTPVTEGKSHNCATHVEHSKWGKGECIAEGHAEPDENGNVAWYNVIFEHGTEKVNTDDVKVVKSSHHMHASRKRNKKKVKANEAGNPKINISTKRGEEFLKKGAVEVERCPHDCKPDAAGVYRHPDQAAGAGDAAPICPECGGKGYVPGKKATGRRPSGLSRYKDPAIGRSPSQEFGMLASVKVEDNSLDAWNTKMQGEEGFQIGDFVDIDDPDDEYASQAEWVVVQVEGDSVTVAKVDENDVRTLPAQNVTRTGGGSTSQVSSMLDAAAGGDFISYLNTIEFEERGAAALVEWLARYNLGAS
jgi:hypothetical protein